MAFTVVFQKVREGYIGFVEELPGANTQGTTLKEARENLNQGCILLRKGKKICKDLEIVSP